MTSTVTGLGVGATTAGRNRRSGGRLLAYLGTVFVLVTLNFALPRALPGDPISALLTPGSTTYVPQETLRAELERSYGLDRPVLTQYLDYLANLLRGELGTSIRYQQPVTELVSGRLPWTVLLIVTALILAITVGVLAGVQSGWRRGRPVDQGMLATFVGVRNFPAFFLGSILLFAFAVKLRWFPLAGNQTPFAELGPLASVLDVAYHLVLPAAVVATSFIAGYYLLMRAGVVSELGADYLLAGRAKGLRDRVLKYRYAGRNALLPVVTLAAIHLGEATTVVVVVETVFAYEGMGKLMVDAINFRDYPLLQGCFLVFSVLVVTVNYLADLLYRRLDPRTAQ